MKVNYQQNEDNEQNLKILTGIVTGSRYDLFLNEKVSNLDDYYYRSDKLVHAFSLIFRNLFHEKIKQNPESGRTLLKQFAFANKYRLPFFRRIALFVIGENWEQSKGLFWEIVKENDPMLVFSTHFFYKDLYEVLNRNQTFLSKREIELIRKIIDLGPQNKEENDREYWQFRWYSALRNILPFKECYEKFSNSLNLTYEHFEELGVMTLRKGSVSPFSIEEILKKDNKEILEFIHTFKPKDRWGEANIDGFSSALGKAVENRPDKFSNEIELFKDVYYIYVYHIIYGFREAWKNKKQFNWKKVLGFCKEYISAEKFTSGQFHIENDGWGTTADWVVGSIGNLLTEGMQSDSNAFDLSLLPIAKDILKILVPRLKSVNDFVQTNMDYPTYSVNSTAGKTLRALLDYSLRRARHLKSDDNLPKWEHDIKDLLEESFKKGIIDGYIFTGWYFEQFYFLDKDWITNKVKDYYNTDDKEWLAFLGGFAFGNPPFNKEIYLLFYPHYERAIKNDIRIKISYDRGIIRHIVAFYFWGFEELETEGLLLMIIHKNNHTDILELVNFVWRQESYLKSLKHEETKKFEEIIFNLWSYLAIKYECFDEEDERKILAELSKLIVFAPELNEANTSLLLKSICIGDRNFNYHYLFENLIRLRDRGEYSQTARYIGMILNSIQFNTYPPYFSEIDSNHTINLVIFLYENGEKEIANEFCNKMTKQGHEFLIELYNEYNKL